MSKASNKQAERNADGTLKKGSTANPNGRPPKGYSIAETMREMFNNDPDMKKKLIQAMYEKAVIEKDVAAAKYLSSYVDGMPVQTVKSVETSLEDLINAQDS